MFKFLTLPAFLAYRNIKRGRKWTFFLTIFLMAVAFINLVFVSALFNGIIQGGNEQVRNTLTSNIIVKQTEATGTIRDFHKKLDKINEQTDVVASTSAYVNNIELSKDKQSGVWPMHAIEPEEYQKVFTLKTKISEGEYLNDEEGSILIGRDLISDSQKNKNPLGIQNLNIGDEVSLKLNNKSVTFKIRGIFDYNFKETNSRVYINKKDLTKFGTSSNDIANNLYVKTKSINPSPELINKINDIVPSSKVLAWDEAADVMKTISDSFVSINILMSIVGILIAATTTFIVIYVDIINRRRSIGILRAIGIRPYIIINSYIILALVYSMLGVILGSLIFQFGLVPYFNAHPFVIPITKATLRLTFGEYIIRTQTILVISALSGLIPSIIAIRGQILDSIRGK